MLLQPEDFGLGGAVTSIWIALRVEGAKLTCLAVASLRAVEDGSIEVAAVTGAGVSLNGCMTERLFGA